MKTFILILTAGLLFFSCSDLNRTKQLASIDKMVKSIDSLSSVLKENQNDSTHQMSSAISAVELRFKTYFVPDTIDPVFANEINDLKQARKALGHFHGDHMDLIKGCDEMKESLRLLRYDIENGDGDRKKYSEYILHEKSKLNTMLTLSKDLVKEQKRCLEVYYRLFEKMDAFSNEQMKKNQKKKGI